MVASLESLAEKGNVLAKTDVTLAVSGKNSGSHPLIVAALAGGKIVGDLRLVTTADDIVVGGLQGLFGCVEPQNHYLLQRRRIRLPRYRCGTALLLGAAASDNYYHWMLDSLPRWKMMQAAEYWNYDYVLLHSQPLRFQDEALDRLNVPLKKRLRCSKNFVHQFERLIVPAMPFPVEEVSAWACTWVRSLFPEKTSGPERIYLRRGAGRRHVVNEAELESALRLRGFVLVEPDQLTVADQSKLLGSARHVIAPHGAALTNLVFAPPGAFLVELFHPQHKNRCYVNLAAACGHRYASVEGRATNHIGARRLEYKVDISAVTSLIDERVRWQAC